MREWQGGEEPETVWRRWRFGQWLYGLSLREFGAGRYRTADWGGFRRSVSGDLDYLNFFGLFGLLGALRLRAMALGLNLFGTGRQMEQVILNTNFKYIVAGLTLAQRGLLLNMLLQAGMRGDASGDEAVDNIYRYIVLEQEGIKLHAKKQRMREIGAKGLAARWGNVAAMEEETGGNGSGMAGNGSQNGMAARERKEAKENKYNNLNYFLFEEIEKEEVKGKEEKKGESVAAAVMEDRMLCGAGGNTVGTADAAETACATALKTDGRAGVAQELLKLDNRPRVPDIECGGAESECSVVAGDDGTVGVYHGVPTGCGGSEVSGSEVPVGGWPLKEKTGKRDLQLGARRYGALTGRGGFCETDEIDVRRCGLAAGVEDCEAAGQAESLFGNKGQVAADDSGRYGAAGRGGSEVSGSEVLVGGWPLKEKTGKRDLQLGARRYGVPTGCGGFCETDETNVGRCGLAAGVEDCEAAGQAESLFGNKGQVAADGSGRYGAAGCGGSEVSGSEVPVGGWMLRDKTRKRDLQLGARRYGVPAGRGGFCETDETDIGRCGLAAGIEDCEAAGQAESLSGNRGQVAADDSGRYGAAGRGGSEVSGSEVSVGGRTLKEKTGERDLQSGAERYGALTERGGFCETDETDVGRCGLAAGVKDCKAAGQTESLSGNKGQVAADDSGRYGAAGRGATIVTEIRQAPKRRGRGNRGMGRQRKETVFKIPSVAEVQAFVDADGLKVDAGTFVDFYDSRGWRVGKTAIKNWQATARLWHRRAVTEQQDKAGGGVSGGLGLPLMANSKSGSSGDEEYWHELATRVDGEDTVALEADAAAGTGAEMCPADNYDGLSPFARFMRRIEDHDLPPGGETAAGEEGYSDSEKKSIREKNDSNTEGTYE